LRVAWSDSTNGHVSTFASDDSYLSDVVIPNGQIRGFVAHDDGSFAVLVWDRIASLDIQQWSSGGGNIWTTVLETNRSIDFDLGDGRLVLGSSAAGVPRYEAYYKVHSVTGGCSDIPPGHEGDSLSYISLAGVATLIWCWGAGVGGCSHSMAMLLSHNDNLNATVPVCVTDCFPGAQNIVCNWRSLC